MAKDRIAVTCNGRTAFYACMWEDIRQCAMDCGWAVSLHGSLASDMDIMAMPWVENAVSFKEMIDRVSKLFKDNDMSSQYVITYNEKPHNRVVATIPIWSDFYLDISTINTTDVEPKGEEKREGEWLLKHIGAGHYMKMKLDYNSLMRMIVEVLNTENKSEEEIAEVVKDNAFGISFGLELLTSYMKDIATLAIERNDKELLEICKALLIVTEKGE